MNETHLVSNSQVQPQHIAPANESFADYEAEYHADEAAKKGKWESWALPGFKASAGRIALDARIDSDHEDALMENSNRDEDKREEEHNAKLDAEAAKADLSAEIDEAFDEAIGENEHYDGLNAREAAEQAERDADVQAESDAYWAGVEADEAEAAKRSRYNINGDDDEDDTDADREAGGGTTSQERYAAAVEQDQAEYELDHPSYDDLTPFADDKTTR